MKIPAAFLILGALLIMALPAAADGILHPGLGKEFSSISLNDRFDGGRNVDVWGSRSFLVANTFFSALRNDHFRHDGEIDWNFYGRGSSILPVSKDWSVNDEGGGWDGRGKKEDLGATAVPEPTSLSFLLLGLAAVGFLRPRRMASSRTI